MLRATRRIAAVLLTFALAGRAERAQAQEAPREDASSAWFAGVEVGLFVPFPAVGTSPTFQNVGLHSTASPRADFGYRFDDGTASRLSYRNLSLSGHKLTDSLIPGLAPTDLHLRLEANLLDWDLVSDRDGPRLGGTTWEFGLRLASRFIGTGTASASGSAEYRYRFFGVGPHFGVGRTLPFGRSGFGLFARADAALLFGGENYRSETTTAAVADPFFPQPATSSRHTGPWDFRLTADASAQVGLSYRATLGSRAGVRGLFGVQVETVGFGSENLQHFGPRRVHNLDGLFGAGPFLRCEISF